MSKPEKLRSNAFGWLKIGSDFYSILLLRSFLRRKKGVDME